MTHHPAPVEINATLTDSRMQGYAVDGTLIIDIEFQPVFKYLVGDKNTETCVTRWVVSPDYVRRLAALAKWQMLDYQCRAGTQ